MKHLKQTGIALVVALGLAGCVGNGSKYAEQKPSANSGGCDYNPPTDQPQYSWIKNEDLGQCIHVRTDSNKVARALLPGKEYLFASECDVEIDLASHLHPVPKSPDSNCTKDSDPLSNDDRMKIYESGKGKLTIVYTFAAVPRTVAAELVPVKMDMGGSVMATVAYKASIPAYGVDKGYNMYVYLKHDPSGPSNVNRFYRVEVFGLGEGPKCHAEAPGGELSTKMPDCPVAVEKEDPADAGTRQTGSGQGGDPPKSP